MMSNAQPPRKMNPKFLLGAARASERSGGGVSPEEFEPVPLTARRKPAVADEESKATSGVKKPAGIAVGTRAQRPVDAADESPVPVAAPRKPNLFLNDAPAGRPVKRQAAVEPEVEVPATPQVSRGNSGARRVNPRFADPGAATGGTPNVRFASPAKKQAAEGGEPQRARRVNAKFSMRDETDYSGLAEIDTDDVAATIRGGTPGRGSVFGGAGGDEFDLTPRRQIRPQFKTTKTARSSYVPPSERRGEADIEVESWTADTATDTEFGVGGEKEPPAKSPKYGKALHISDRDIIMLKFLARYRYAYVTQLARLVDTTASAINQRLRQLEQRGLVSKQHVSDRQFLWMTTKAGNLLIDSNFRAIKKGELSYATIAHTIGLANLGVELEREAGGRDILGEREDPDDLAAANRWRFGIRGHDDGLRPGEMTVTEREIRQGQTQWRGRRTTTDMREMVDLAVGAKNLDTPPELEEGNEGLFVVYGAGGQAKEHVPDLVVTKERDAETGRPLHIAIELELTGKPLPKWREILRWYRDNGVLFDKVYYFTHKRSIATALREADAGTGTPILGDRLVIRKYIPVNGRVPFWG